MMPGQESVRIVLTTVGDHDAAERLARTLVDERLIACANLLPGVASVYRWEGEVQTEREVLLLLKTTDMVLDRLRHRLAEIHPYQVPEIVCLPPAVASSAYSEWVATETAGAGA